jgi:hypothetical protein
MLECTAEGNIPFYERYGFKVEEVFWLRDVEDEDHSVALWIMIRRV